MRLDQCLQQPKLCRVHKKRHECRCDSSPCHSNAVLEFGKTWLADNLVGGLFGNLSRQLTNATPSALPIKTWWSGNGWCLEGHYTSTDNCTYVHLRVWLTFISSFIHLINFSHRINRVPSSLCGAYLQCTVPAVNVKRYCQAVIFRSLPSWWHKSSVFGTP